jgi:DNA polymerase-3 subunit gamma/tau
VSTHLALARKWRPQRFEDVIGQRGVVETLKNAITSGRIAQSFIFAGPRGVGKTTTARILARALNCVNGPTPEPCGQCDACLEIAEGRDVDVLEIDGATYTGVDAVREVIVEPLGLAPMRDRYKIFIIDEVHRLSKNAFDALLKSIEEPPPYVRFMMATTELHSVPATIQSRSQIFELKALPFVSIREQLKSVAAREGVAIEDGALALVARSAEGSMRDALSALDQVLAFTSESVTADDVSAVLGLPGRDLQFRIAETVAREDLPAVFPLAGEVVEAGFDLRVVCRELARLMRDLLVVQIDPRRLDDREIAAEGEEARLKELAALFSREDLMRAFDLLGHAELDIKNASQPRHHFEMTLVKWIHLRQLTPLTELIGGLEGGGGDKLRTSNFKLQTAAKPEARVPTRNPAPATARSSNDEAGSPAKPEPGSSVVRSSKFEVRSSAPAESAGPGPGPDPKPAFLAAIREQNKVFYGMVVAQAQKVEVEGDTVVFTFTPVHKTLRLRLEEKRAWLEQIAQAAAGRRLKIVTRESAPAPAAAPAQPSTDTRRADLVARAQAEPSVQAVLDVFGGEIEDVEEMDEGGKST